MPTSDLASIAAFWDAAADTFDDEADHGLRDPRIREAWARRLVEWLPEAPADILDLGCGTGSLTLLLAELGHRPTGVDLSPRMIDQATRKLTAAGFHADLAVGDASDPPVTAYDTFDVILVRHLVWTLPRPEEALDRWLGLLRPQGRLVLVEGHWDTAGDDGFYVPDAVPLPWLGGVPASRLVETLEPRARIVHIEQLTDPLLWGRPIDDERYVVIARPKGAGTTPEPATPRGQAASTSTFSRTPRASGTRTAAE
ncbi:methyltransferase domain-containing protein [Microbispora sp. RL4-1S]|uniref:Methyltransferase domain-containing protein n=1 Tax=Microbispora oryzae TaxID=2806554 RepID=A0A940WP60_9ACTN|nr:class I SAM-dependent methyltransferase [Microbispora oryzae]MBP2704319.1 methyltransferase domain-containing protein [Microbispora oryzae]